MVRTVKQIAADPDHVDACPQIIMSFFYENVDIKSTWRMWTRIQEEKNLQKLAKKCRILGEENNEKNV